MAVLTVIAAHAGVGLLSGGYVGVDAFYVISGYLIAGLLFRDVLRGGSFSLTEFWSRRARRILPAATLVTTATVVVSLFWLSLIEARQVVTDAATVATVTTVAAGRIRRARRDPNAVSEKDPPATTSRKSSPAIR
jgi:peptidoglycan/LPS O-acetylase OafA/YrhL